MIEFKANIKKLINCLLSGPLYQLVRSLALSNEVPYNGDLAFLDSASPRPEHMLQPVCMNDEVLFDISVIIPVYNVQKYLKDCLDSVVSQSIDGTYEVIIVNDGSTDNSGAIVHSYAQVSNIQVVDQSNGGLSAARNAGLRLSRGKYIMFVDSDDALAPGYLRAMKDRLDRTPADYVTSTFRYMSDDGMLGEQEKDRASWMAPWGRLYRRRVWMVFVFRLELGMKTLYSLSALSRSTRSLNATTWTAIITAFGLAPSCSPLLQALKALTPFGCLMN